MEDNITDIDYDSVQALEEFNGSHNNSGVGQLYLCATPIGNLEDITFRVLRILKEVDIIAAEDTRNSIKLLNHFEINTPMTSYHEYNKYDKAKVLVEKMLKGMSVAVITDAGTPGISDPGEELVRQALASGIKVSSVPGAAACITALTMSGQATRRFAFEAFLPADKNERKDILKELEDETRLRGDIHILIVGDPGIGKSQMLKYVSKLAPRSIYTSGKGTTGAGLTAAAVRDELGGWSLEAGALVLGDQGNVCVDELDKMRSEDRSALHEALEQQTVSIAKAGIMATLNSRCSVLAAANPKFGRFDRFKILAEQIDLPSPILSRFDLIFVVEDKPSVKGDSELAQHILQIHQQNTVNYEIEPELLRKYIAYARKNVNPKLTDEANMVLKEFYVSTRNSSGDEESPVPITARQLEAIIRLAEASAKIRLKDTVDKEDAQKAVRLQLACLKEVGVDPETGEIDIDKVEGRTPKSDRDKLQRIISEIEILEEEYAGQAPMNVLVSNMSDKYDMSEEKVDEMVRNLKHKGVIYEPTNGYLKRA